MATAAIAAAAVYRKHLRAFRNSGAVDQFHARTLAELELRDSRIFRSLLRRGEVVETAPGRYYLDLERVAERAARARKAALILLAVLAAGLATLYLWQPLR